MSELIYCHNLAIANEQQLDDIPGFRNFRRVAAFLQPSFSLNDRTGTIVNPFKTKITDPIPKFDFEFNLTYEECVMLRIAELDNLYMTTGRPIRLMYSGGVDSAVVLTGLIKYYGLEKAGRVVEICCSKESIDENPWLWDRYVRKGKFKLVLSHKHTTNWHDCSITVNAELNDMLHGGNGLASYRKNKNLYSKVDLDAYIDQHIRMDKPGPDALYYIDILRKQATAAPFPLETAYQMAWWHQFSMYYHTIKMVAQATFDKIPDDVVNIVNYNFYNTDYFQQWGMKYHYDFPDRYCEFEHYRKFPKEFILASIDIPEYSEKIKNPSYPRIHTKRLAALYIDDEYNMYRNIDDIRNFIEPNNSFL